MPCRQESADHLEQEVTWALADGDIEAIQARYAELRERYFGMAAYN